MNITPAGMGAGLPFASPLAGAPTASTGNLFGSVVERFVTDTNAQQLAADKSVELLATGQSEGVHETMLALAKADLSLRLFMEVRNKAIDAYQEVMRMQL